MNVKRISDEGSLHRIISSDLMINFIFNIQRISNPDPLLPYHPEFILCMFTSTADYLMSDFPDNLVSFSDMIQVSSEVNSFRITQKSSVFSDLIT